jgi:hypothetical protein
MVMQTLLRKKDAVFMPKEACRIFLKSKINSMMKGAAGYR